MLEPEQPGIVTGCTVLDFSDRIVDPQDAERVSGHRLVAALRQPGPALPQLRRAGIARCP